MKVTTEKGFREKIRAACRGVGTYREEFEGMIHRLAELYVRREATKDEFRKSGGKAIIKQVNKGLHRQNDPGHGAGAGTDATGDPED